VSGVSLFLLYSSKTPKMACIGGWTAFVGPSLAPTVRPQGVLDARRSLNDRNMVTSLATSTKGIGLGAATAVVAGGMMRRRRVKAPAAKLGVALRASLVDSSLDTYFEFGDGYFFETEDMLGSGAYGKVFKCKNKNKPGEEYAVKWIFAGDKEQLVNEIAAHQHLGKHRYICELIASYDREGVTDKYVVMELVKGGMLSDHLEKNGGQSEEWCKIIFKQVLEALQHVHSKKILHRDLKCSNILLKNDDPTHPNIKLIDFGASKWCKDEPFTGKKFIGTLQSVAPEVISARGDDFDAGDEAQIETTHEIVYKKRPFGIRKYRPGLGGNGAKVKILGEKPRYPGDPIGQAFAAGVEVDWAVKTVNGQDVSQMTMDDIIDTMGDRLLDNSSRGAFDGSFKVTGDNKGKGKVVPKIEPVELPVTVVYAQMKPRPYGPESDIWSLGSVLFHMRTGTEPFELDEENVLKGNYVTPADSSPEFLDLLSKMFVVDPKKRASLDEVAAHPWLQ